MHNMILFVLSSITLVLSFPKSNAFVFVWVSLIPFLFIIENKSLRQAFGLGYVFGIIFFLGIIYWLYYVTGLGMVVLVLYFSLYFSLFAICVVLARRLSLLMKALFLSSVWVVLEFIRANLFTGFDWGSLGQSQAFVPYIIQIADVTGMYGISFIIIFVNVCLKEWIVFGLGDRKKLFELQILSIVTCVLLSSVCLYGVWRVYSIHFDRYVTIGVVQGNILQEDKWRSYKWPSIMKKYEDITQRLLKNEDVDLIVWPETSYPGILWDDIKLYQDLLEKAREYATPLILGAVVVEGDQYFNTTMLLDDSAVLRGMYKKIHLVPFGEYVPWRNFFPVLSNIIPIDDFSSGEHRKVFSLETEEGTVKFSTLICFEDTVSDLARQFTNAGAEVLINMTNDAWFMDTKAPYLHLVSSIFRSVENRRSLVRSSNTGVSAFINPLGRVVKYLSHIRSGKQTFVEGYSSYRVPISDKKTFYGQFPKVFIYFCLAYVICGVVCMGFRRKDIS